MLNRQTPVAFVGILAALIIVIVPTFFHSAVIFNLLLRATAIHLIFLRYSSDPFAAQIGVRKS